MSMYGAWARHPFALDPNKPAAPQIFWTVVGVGYVFAGPLLGMVTLAHFPPLWMDSTIYTVGLGGMAVCFLLSFPVIPNRRMPRGLPLSMNLVARAGWALCAMFLLLGIGGIANGYGMPTATRDVPAVAKHHTRHTDPSRRSYYLSVRAWPGARQVVDLPAPADVYARLDLPVSVIGTPQADLVAMPDAGVVRLTVGQGRLGQPWLKSVGTP